MEELNNILQEEKDIVKSWAELCPAEVLEKVPFAAKVYLMHLGMVDGLGVAKEIISEKEN